MTIGQTLRLVKFAYNRLRFRYRGTDNKKSLASLQGFTYLAPRPGFEPGTCGLTVRRSTD